MKTLKVRLGRTTQLHDFYIMNTDTFYEWDKYVGFLDKKGNRASTIGFCKKTFEKLTDIKLDKGECRQVIIKIGLANE